MREAEIVGSNPSNARKNRTRAYSRKKSRDLRKLWVPIHNSVIGRCVPSSHGLQLDPHANKVQRPSNSVRT